MKVRNNSASINVLRRFGMNQTEMKKDLEKLSSGYKINKAGDDAAGLAVSESMRERIKGLDQGHNNINDGMSLINVAEGGMEEITDMLQRISKLAHQAVNDTYNKENRNEIQMEINELKNEIARIAENTEFNEIKVLRLKDKSTYEIFKKEGLPDWMSTTGVKDGEMTKGNITFSTQDPKNPNQTMLELTGYNTETERFKYTYYGPEGTLPEDTDVMEFEYGREWTETLDDNLGAVMSFKGLADRYTPGSTTYDATKTDADLYRDVYDLLGSSIGVACATCDDPGVLDPHYYGFAFYGTATDPDTGKTMEYLKDGMRYVDENGNPAAYIDHRNAVDISQIKAPDENGIPLFEYLSYRASQNCDVAETATVVAKRLFDETYKNLESYISGEDHFNVACKDESSMTIGIYDYRDADTIGQDTVKVFKSSMGRSIVHPDALWIQCSSLKDDRIPLKLPYVDIDDLGISDFDVSTYREATRNVYNPADVAREQAERADQSKYNTVHTDGYTVTKTLGPYDIPIYGELPNEHGEMVKTKVGSVHYPEQEVTQTIPPSNITTYTGYKANPTGVEDVSIYTPSNIDNVAKAIEKIASFRAIVGVQYNRLEHSRNNNEVMNENVNASESRIRDTNMADAMSKFQKDSMLISVSEKMLGVADESTRGILDLLG
ncbi:MAG: hypothetical protein J6I76_09510 [Oribacterium sp.]|nr:hypothetical protein [Oribacterium sp.]